MKQDRRPLGRERMQFFPGYNWSISNENKSAGPIFDLPDTGLAMTNGPPSGSFTFDTGSGMEMTSSYAGRQEIGRNANGTVTIAYPTRRQPLSIEEAETLQGLPVFLHSSTKRWSLEKGVYDSMTLPELNRHLMSAECRRRYGSKKYAATQQQDGVGNEWQFAGIYAHNHKLQVDDYMGNERFTVEAIHVDGRVRMPDIFCANGHVATAATTCFLVWVRKKYIRPERIVQDSDGVQVIYDAASDDENDNPGNNDDYYWQCIPWSTPGGSPVPFELYMNSEFVGFPITLGPILEMYGKQSDKLDNQKKIMDGVCPNPAERPGKHVWTLKAELPEVELYLHKQRVF